MNCILRPFGPAFSLAAIVFFRCVSPAEVCAQENSSTPAPVTADIKLTYPNNPGGLQKLAKDILKAQRETNTTFAGQLLQSLILPDPRGWYAANFRSAAAAQAAADYLAVSKAIPVQMGSFFLDTQQSNASSISAVRFDKTCDENTSVEIINTLHDRNTTVPLYELRFFDGNKFRRLSLFAFVDGAFRFVLLPKSTPEKKPLHEESGEPKLIYLEAPKLIKKVAPRYPELARSERLQGTVRLHAIIAKDGSIRALQLEQGVCSLAEASFDAVRQWRYSPTLLMGQPVEVVTIIDVIFALNQ